MQSPFIWMDPVQEPPLFTPLTALALAALTTAPPKGWSWKLCFGRLTYSEQLLNINTDSKYVFTVFQTVEMAIISHAVTEEIFHLFHKAQLALRQRTHPVYVGHLRAHTGLPGPLTAGNAAADAAACELLLQGLTLVLESPLLDAQHSSAISSKFPDS